MGYVYHGSKEVGLDVIKRNVISLCKYKNQVIRLDKVSKKVSDLLELYNTFEDAKYCYMIGIK